MSKDKVKLYKTNNQDNIGTEFYKTYYKDGPVAYKSIIEKVKLNPHGKNYLETKSVIYNKGFLWGINKLKEGTLTRKDIKNRTGLPTRICQDIYLKAVGKMQGFIESTTAHIEYLNLALERLFVEYFEVIESNSYIVKGYNILAGLESKFIRLSNELTSAEEQLQKRSIFIGRNTVGTMEYYNNKYKTLGCVGSHEEIGGNAFRLQYIITKGGRALYEVINSRKVIGCLSLDKQQSKIVKELLKNKVGLHVTFRKKRNAWYMYVTYNALDLIKPTESINNKGSLGVDLNCSSIAYCETYINNGLNIGRYGKDSFDPKWLKHRKEEWLRNKVKELVKYCKDHNLILVLEKLDFEYNKPWLKNKLGKMLRIMPYRAIRAMFERYALLEGVELRFVKPNYTSILGSIISEIDHRLGRDEAAGAVIGLRGDNDGNNWLETTSDKLLRQPTFRTRLNIKNFLGKNLNIEQAQPQGVLGRAIKDKTTLDRRAETTTRGVVEPGKQRGHVFNKQICLGKTLGSIIKMMRNYGYAAKLNGKDPYGSLQSVRKIIYCQAKNNSNISLCL